MAEASSSSRSRLTVLTGPMAGKELVLDETVDNVLIGSDPSCRFHVPSPGVSPIHARLWMDASGVTVYDTSSARGLYVNDDRVSGQAPLRNGDILWLGTPGEDDVVMIQCRLPSRAGAAAPPTPPPITPPPETRDEDAEETMVLTTSPEMAEAVAEAVAEEQPAEDRFAPAPEIDIDAEPATFEAVEPEPIVEPLPVEEPAAIVEPEPAAEPVLEAVEEEAAPAPLPEPLPDEFAIQDTQFLDTPFPPPVEEVPEAPPTAGDELLAEAPPAEVAPEAEAGEEPPFPTPEVASTPFEDEIGHPLADAEAPTAIMAEPPLAAHEEEMELHISPPPVRVEPPSPPPPRPKPAAPPPSPPAPAPPRPRPAPHARPAHPPVAAHPPARPRPAKPSSPIGMYAFLGGAVLLLLIAAGLFVARKQTQRATAPTPAPLATTPTTMAFRPPPTTVVPEPPVTTAAPVEEAVTILSPPPATTLAPAAPSPAAAKTPAPSPKAAAPSPSPKAPSPSPRVAAAPSAPPPGPSAEALRAQQAATLLGQAEAAAAARSYDSAAGLYDEVLKLDPQNAKAHAGKAAALASVAALKKTFVAGRTSVQSGKAGKGSMAGFDTEDVNLGKAPDYSGRIEFEVSPRSVRPGDNYVARVLLTNDGKKAFKIGTLNVTTTANGSKSGGPVASTVKEVQPQQRVTLQEVSGVWQEGTTAWSLEVAVVSDRGDTFKNTVVWR